MYKAEEDRYNTYGRLKDRVLDDVQPGDIVKYRDAVDGLLPNGRRGTVYVDHIGIWDGEKVEFEYKHTIVKTLEWLTLIGRKI